MRSYDDYKNQAKESETLILSNLQKLNSGFHRDTYLHPEHPDLVLKNCPKAKTKR